MVPRHDSNNWEETKTASQDALHRKVEANCPLLSLRPQENRNNKVAVVACGCCCWSAQRRFQRVVGVKRVTVGYTGGEHCSPTFDCIEDHTKALLIEYDPSVVTYEKLLWEWLDNVEPWEIPETRAVRLALFVINRKQRKEALEFLSSLVDSEPKCQLYVDVEQAITFYRAEEHQQDYLRKKREIAENQLSTYMDGFSHSALYVIWE